MAMATGGGSGSNVKAEPNVTPMIDVMLVLLIIFMVVAVRVDPLDLGLDGGFGDRLLVQVVVAILVDAENLIVLGVFGMLLQVLTLRGLGIEAREERRRHHHEDDEEHEHDVDHRRHVRLRLHSTATAG